MSYLKQSQKMGLIENYATIRTNIYVTMLIEKIRLQNWMNDLTM